MRRFVAKYVALSQKQAHRRERLRGLVDQAGIKYGLNSLQRQAFFKALSTIPPEIESAQKAKFAQDNGIMPNGIIGMSEPLPEVMRDSAIAMYAARSVTFRDLQDGGTIPAVTEEDMPPATRKAALRKGRAWFSTLNSKPWRHGKGRPKDDLFNSTVQNLSHTITEALSLPLGRVTFTRDPYDKSLAKGPAFDLLCATLELWFFARTVSAESVASLLSRSTTNSK
ncbi:hypothetical protein [Candidatus Igneacidithiobacillus taiwanensis]|uniref:hypothetical protein n=1 Tax=Candidatus Igneacidithiobacillus taiwanensis TaxID=1945924 RepID=UPI00289A6289|nr:hypothetical protein [Candidatus Igneacidithiobacillus taiwanensis]